MTSELRNDEDAEHAALLNRQRADAEQLAGLSVHEVEKRRAERYRAFKRRQAAEQQRELGMP